MWILSIILGSIILSFLENRRHRKALDNIRREYELLRKQDEIQSKIDFIIQNYDPVDSMPYRKELTEEERKFNQSLMNEYLAKYPNSKFWADHPEFIDISEITELPDIRK